MTVTISVLAFYSFAILVLFLTPGPVWLAIIGRSLSFGFKSVIPLAFGVFLGDLMWSSMAIFGGKLLADSLENALLVVRYLGAGLFIYMGLSVIYYANEAIAAPPEYLPEKVNKERAVSKRKQWYFWTGFMAGVIAIISNPKAILFYLGLMPSFFVIPELTWSDAVVIALVSASIPFLGNLAIAYGVDFVSESLKTPHILKRINLLSGGLLVLVGISLPLI